MAENKVVFGLKKAHYAIISETGGVFTYGTPMELPGSVELTLEPKGEASDFYADDVLYYTTSSNQGYEATLTIANLTEDFKTDVLGETLVATDLVLEENANAKPKRIAFLFEFDGDIKAIRHCLYNCSVGRPNGGSGTKTETTEPVTTELVLTAAPRPADGVVKRSTTTSTPDSIYNGWYTTVYEPTVVLGEAFGAEEGFIGMDKMDKMGERF